MRILHALVPAPVGGLERVVQMLAIAQRRARHDISIVAVVDPDHGSRFLAPLEAAGVSCRTVTVGARAYRDERRLLGAAMRSEACDLVHTHGYRADVIAGSAAEGLGLPTVSTAHGFTGGGWRNRFYEHLQVRAYRRRGHVVAVARPLRALLLERGVPSDRLHVIRNAWLPLAEGVDRLEARRRLGLPADVFTIGWIGRLGLEKAPDLIVRALPEVADAHLSLCGDGAAREEVAELIRDLGLGDRVRLHGRVPEAARMLSAFDVLALSSRTEGTPVVILEAMSAGVPIVATRVGGVPDMIRHDREALLVPAEDPRALAEAISRVRTDRAAALDRAEAASERVRAAFGPQPWVAAYERVYDLADGDHARA